MAKKQKKPEIIKESKIQPLLKKYFLPGAFAILIILLTTYKISGDDDIFWHLGIGKYVTENKVVPSGDVFGFVTKGQEWIPFEWGFDVLAYNVYSLSGYAGLSIFRSLIFILMFYLIYRITLKLKINVFITFLIFLLLIPAMFERFMVKPQIVSYLFTVIILYIFIHYSFIKRQGSRLIYFLPLIFLVWANMHMGVLSGIVIFTLFLISETFLFFKPKFQIENNNPSSQKDLIRLLAVYAVSILSLLINPHGLVTYTYVYSHLQMKMMGDVFEWRSPFNKLFAGSMYIYAYYTFIIGALAVFYYAYKKRDIFSGLVILVFFLLSFRSARFSIDFMLLVSIFIIISLRRLTEINKTAFIQKSALNIVLLVIMLAGIFLLPGSTIYKYFNFDRITGFGVDQSNYPFGAVNFIKQNNIIQAGNKPFNTYDCGGYLIWEIPGAMNFIDSRGLNDEIYYSFKTINNKHPGFEKKFDSYGFDYVLWSFPKLPWNNTELKTSIVSFLIKNNEVWKLVYWDDVSFVFVRNDQRYKNIIEQNEYKYVNPYYYIFDKEPLQKATYNDPQRITDEIRRNIKLNPEGIFIRAMAKSFNVKP